MDDEALLDRARRGDRSAFADLVNRYQDALYTMALRLLGRPEDAADVVQETFLRAYVNLPRLRPLSVRAWLFRVAINAAHDVHRRARRHPQQGLDDAATKVLTLPDPNVGPEGAAELAERWAAVRAALAELPTELRAAVVLRDVSGLGYEEIAAALGVPLGTVKSRICRGRARLASGLRHHRDLFDVVEA